MEENNKGSKKNAENGKNISKICKLREKVVFKLNNIVSSISTAVNNIITNTANKVDNSDKIKPVIGTGTNLLSFPTLVETPFVIVTIGKYTFGDYSVYENRNSKKVSFPNIVKQLEITKINGDVNKYTLIMEYQIGTGDDPNLLDKVFGSISNTRQITLSYGDWSAPAFSYKEETALITKILSNIDFSGSKITYTISCVSNGYKAKSSKQDFPARFSTNV